jgi:hypothetical protein
MRTLRERGTTDWAFMDAGGSVGEARTGGRETENAAAASRRRLVAGKRAEDERYDAFDSICEVTTTTTTTPTKTKTASAVDHARRSRRKVERRRPAPPRSVDVDSAF